MKFVLDTNVFNRILDGRFSLSEIPNACGFVASKVQLEELKGTGDSLRRAELVAVFCQTDPEFVPAVFSLGVAGAGFDGGGFPTATPLSKSEWI